MVLAFFVLTGCYYDNEEELYGNSCEVVNISYSLDVLPIIESNCFICHAASANQGDVTLEGYGAIIEYVDSGQLIGAITHSGGFSPMPDDAPKLSDCNIQKIQQWVDDGALNN
jgi:hypothetical protein